MNPISEFDFGWLVGILDGEACFRSYLNGCPDITVDMTDLDTIERAARLTGVKVQKRRLPSNPKHNQIYYIKICGDPALELMKMVHPHMSTRRKTRIDRVIERAASRPGHVKGSLHGRAKLKEEWIPVIRELSKRGITRIKIADMCNVAPSTISSVVTNRHWRHV